MAKLGQIRYSSKQRPQTQSPNAAVSAYADRQNVFSSTMNALGQVADKYEEDTLNVATASHRQVGLDTLKFISENETVTREQLEQFGIDSQIEAKNLDGSDMEDVPRHFWSATLLQSELETSRGLYADNLTGVGASQAWTSTMAENDSRAINAAVSNAANDAMQYSAKQLSNNRKVAIEKGDWDLAEQLQQTDLFNDVYASTPGLRNLHSLEVAQGREYDGFDMLMMQGKHDEVMEMAADAERETSLSSDDLRKVYFAAQSTEIKQEAAQTKAEKEFKEDAYIEARAGIADGSVSLQEVIDTRKNYSPAHLSQLITASQSAIDDATKVDSGHAQATESLFITDIDLAARGVFPDGISNLEDYQSRARFDIQAQTTKYDMEGNLVPGLSPNVTRGLLKAVTNLQEIPYTSRQYKGLITEMKLRILRADDTGPSYLAKEDTAQLMAGATDDLHTYMQNELDAGRQPDLGQWEQDNLPRYMVKSARAAFFKLPKALTQFAKYSSDGGKFTVDYEASVKALVDKKAAVLQTNPDANTQGIDKLVTQFGDYWEAYGDFAGK